MALKVDLPSTRPLILYLVDHPRERLSTVISPVKSVEDGSLCFLESEI